MATAPPSSKEAFRRKAIVAAFVGVSSADLLVVSACREMYRLSFFFCKGPLRRFRVSDVVQKITAAFLRPLRTSGFTVMVEFEKSRIFSSSRPLKPRPSRRDE